MKQKLKKLYHVNENGLHTVLFVSRWNCEVNKKNYIVVKSLDGRETYSSDAADFCKTPKDAWLCYYNVLLSRKNEKSKQVQNILNEVCTLNSKMREIKKELLKY